MLIISQAGSESFIVPISNHLYVLVGPIWTRKIVQFFKSTTENTSRKMKMIFNTCPNKYRIRHSLALQTSRFITLNGIGYFGHTFFCWEISRSLIGWLYGIP